MNLFMILKNLKTKALLVRYFIKNELTLYYKVLNFKNNNQGLTFL